MSIPATAAIEPLLARIDKLIKQAKASACPDLLEPLIEARRSMAEAHEVARLRPSLMIDRGAIPVTNHLSSNKQRVEWLIAHAYLWKGESVGLRYTRTPLGIRIVEMMKADNLLAKTTTHDTVRLDLWVELAAKQLASQSK